MAGALIGKLAGSLFSGKGGSQQAQGAPELPQAPRNFGFNNMMNPQQPGGMLPTPPMGGGMGNSMGGGMGGMLKNRLFGG